MKTTLRLFAVATLLFALGLPAYATSDAWQADADGLYYDSANWLGGNVPGATNNTISSDTAWFTNSLTAARTVTSGGVYAISNFFFANPSANGFTITGGTFRINTGGTIQSLLGGGAHTDTIASTINLRGTGNSVFTFANNSASSGLVISGNINSAPSAGKFYTIYLEGTNLSAGNSISGVINDTGSSTPVLLVKNGTGFWMLAATNTYVGDTTINAGTLQLGNGSTRNGVIASNIINNASLVFANPNSQTHAALISGPGSLTKTGNGTLTLSNTNTYTGNTTLNGGLLNVNATETAGTSGPLGASGTISFGGGTLQFSAANTNDYSARFSTAAGQAFNIDTGGQTVTLAANLASSGGTFTKSGTGTLILSGDNSFDGGFTNAAGTIKIAHAHAFGAGNVTFNGGIWNPGGNFTITNNIYFAGNMSGNSGTSATEFAGRFSGSGTWSVNGFTGGTVKLSGDNTNWSGNWKFTGANKLQLNNIHALGTSAAVTFSDAGTGRGVLESLVDLSGGVGLTNNVILGTAAATTNWATLRTTANMQISGVISGPDGNILVKDGAATLILSGGNTYTGSTTNSAGTLLVNGTLASTNVVVTAGTLGGTGAIAGVVNVMTGATLRPGLGGTDTTALTVTGNVTLAAGSTNRIVINRANTPNAGKLVVGGTFTLGGTLHVTNSGANPVAGDTFTLFTVTAPPAGSFAATNLPALDSTLNWWSVVSGADLNLVVNTKPVATNINLGAQVDVLQTLQIINSPKYAPTDADSDSLSLAAVTAGTNGGVATISGENVTYSNNVAGLDSFDYVVTDSRGGYATNTVFVNVTNVANQQTPQLSFNGTNIDLVFWGVPGTNYTVQTATVVTGPWTDLVPTVDASTSQPYGRISFTDTNVPGSGTGFYRLKP